MSDPTPQQIDWYINWYNKQEPKRCPDCDEPMVAKKNAEGEVFIDLQHKDDCGLHADWVKFEKENPGHSSGTLWLMWNQHRRKV